MSKYSYQSLETTWLELFWQIVSKNKNIIINNHYTGQLLSANTNITLERILTNPDFNWWWHEISKNPSITIDTIESNPGLNWDWKAISGRPDLTIDFVLRNLDKPLDFTRISSHKNITWEHVKQYPNIPWDYWFLSKNPNITLDIVLENPKARDSSGHTWRWELFVNNDFTLSTLDQIYQKTDCVSVYTILHNWRSFQTFLVTMKLTQ